MAREYPRPCIVISRCIEFDPCRYDGKIPSPLVAHLRSFADCIPVCPEVEIGLGIPRATVRIVRIDGVDHLIQPATGRDVTPEMTGFANRFLDSLPPIDGFILKGGSPTSGTSGVRVYPTAEKSMAVEKTAGFFALHGPLNEAWKGHALEINGREILAISPLMVLMLVIGVWPAWIVGVINATVTRLFG